MTHSRRWRGWLAIAVLCLAAAWARPAAADPFTVTGVKVDVTAENAVAARDRAIGDAERKAFTELVTRLAGADAAAKVAGLSAAQISTLVRDFAIESEKASSVRYIGTLTVRFKPDGVRGALAQRGISYSLDSYKPIAVVPLFESNGSVALWDDPNPWRRAWDAHPRRDALVQTIVPTGDLNDVTVLTPDQALAGDTARLLTLAQRHGANDVLVSKASVDGNTLTVTTTRYTGSGRDFDLSHSFAATPGESREALMARAIRSVAADLQSRLTQRTVVRPAIPREAVQVTAYVTSLQDWFALRSALERSPVIRGVDLLMVARNRVRINLAYLGDVDQLTNALAAINLTLEQDGDVWFLRRGSGGPAGGV